MVTHIAYRKHGRSDLWMYLFDFDTWLRDLEWRIEAAASSRPAIYGSPDLRAAARDRAIAEMCGAAIDGPVSQAAEVLQIEGEHRNGIWQWGNATHVFDGRRLVPVERAAA